MLPPSAATLLLSVTPSSLVRPTSLQDCPQTIKVGLNQVWLTGRLCYSHELVSWEIKNFIWGDWSPNFFHSNTHTEFITHLTFPHSEVHLCRCWWFSEERAYFISDMPYQHHSFSSATTLLHLLTFARVNASLERRNSSTLLPAVNSDDNTTKYYHSIYAHSSVREVHFGQHLGVWW